MILSNHQINKILKSLKPHSGHLDNTLPMHNWPKCLFIPINYTPLLTKFTLLVNSKYFARHLKKESNALATWSASAQRTRDMTATHLIVKAALLCLN